jgi:hypothetical protein
VRGLTAEEEKTGKTWQKEWKMSSQALVAHSGSSLATWEAWDQEDQIYKVNLGKRLGRPPYQLLCRCSGGCHHPK